MIGYIFDNDIPRWGVGLKPIAATFMIMASTPLAIISLSSSVWSLLHR
jgi:hypothetical protein